MTLDAGPLPGSQLAGAVGLLLVIVASAAIWFTERQQHRDAARAELDRLHAAHGVAPDSLMRDLLVVSLLPNPASVRVDAVAYCTVDKRLYRRNAAGWDQYEPRPVALHRSDRNDNAARSEERTARRTHERTNPNR